MTRMPKKEHKDIRKRVSFNQEKKLARLVGGRVRDSRKWDVKTSCFDIECKTVLQGKQQITIKKSTIEKLSKEAFDMGLYPAMCFSFSDVKAENDWVAMPASIQAKLIKFYEKNKGANYEI